MSVPYGLNLPPDLDPTTGGSPALWRVLDESLTLCRSKIVSFQQNPTPAWFKRNIHGHSEPVTDLDCDLQDVLTGALQRAFPGVPVIGEEGQTHLPALPPDCLLIDPIDGTAPFLAGQPWYAIAVALVRGSQVHQTVIDLPHFALRVGITNGVLGVHGDLRQLPAFNTTDVLTSPRHVDRVALALAGHGLCHLRARAVPTATCKMLLVALGRARAALYLPQVDGVAAWDYAAASLALTVTGATLLDDTGHDLSDDLPNAIHGWAASHDTAHPVFDVLANLSFKESP
jgi:fructose-1,6-bisphosphatase/inositol monophosphatase family enzyme